MPVPRELDGDRIAKDVRVWHSVYLLCLRIRDVPRWVERADKLYERLASQVNKGIYKWVRLKYLKAPRTAFHRECNLRR